MNLDQLKKYYDENELKEVQNYLESYMAFLAIHNSSLDNQDSDVLELYMEALIESKNNTMDRLLALARYFYGYGYQQLYLFMTGVLGGIGVVDSINRKSEKVLEKGLDLKVPMLGETPKKMCRYTHHYMETLKTLEPEQYKNILADNHHQIPKSSMDAEKKYYEQSDSLEAYLVERHQRKVAELQEHCDENKIWYEQKITQAVVDYVAENQEILSGVMKDGDLYITKFPYHPEGVFNAENDLMRRYHYCHCAFAKASILTDHPVDSDWCYCSGGFAKFPFEVILGRTLEVTLLESVLKGDDKCRFKVRIENGC